MKKHISAIFRGLQIVGVALFLAVGPGCDTSDPNTSGTDNYFDQNPFGSQPRDPVQPGILTITPNQATVTFIGQQVNFRVTDGTPPYTWSVALDTVGSVSPVSGSQTIYTAAEVSANSVIVHDSKGQSAVANISASAVAMTVAPAETTLEENFEMVTFTITGGTAPFVWKVFDPELGKIVTGGTTSSEVYQRLQKGDNSITITDSLGNSVNAVVHQP